MVTDVLVDEKLEDGLKVVAEMAKEGYPASVAFWLKAAPDESWRLYLSSPAIEPGKVGNAFVTLYHCIERLPNSSVALSDVKLLYDGERIVKEAAAARDKGPRRYLPVRLRGGTLGTLAVDEAYIYPQTAVSHASI